MRRLEMKLSLRTEGGEVAFFFTIYASRSQVGKVSHESHSAKHAIKASAVNGSYSLP